MVWISNVLWTLSPGLAVWNIKRKQIISLELTVLREENISDAVERKEEWYEKLLNNIKEKFWVTVYYHFAVGCREHVDKKIKKLFRNRFRLQLTNLYSNGQRIATSSGESIFLRFDEKGR